MEQERRNKELIMQDATLGTGMCDGSVYRTCTLCDYDICQKCLEIESLPSPEKEEVLKQKVNKIIKKEEARRMRLRQERDQRHEAERLKREEEYKDYLKKLAPTIKYPTGKRLNSKKKLKYTVWTSYRDDNDNFDDDGIVIMAHLTKSSIHLTTL